MSSQRETLGTTGFVDIHSHFVYGLDDGAQDLQEMYAMLDAAYEDGISVLYATPHVIPGVQPFPEQLFFDRLNLAREYCREKKYPLTLNAGAELLYTPFMRRHIEEQRLIAMGESDAVLIEFAPEIAFRELAEVISFLERNGYTPILAHAERYRCLFSGKCIYGLKKNHNIYLQLNANTLLTKQGFFRDYAINRWLKDGLVDHIASDAHHIASRPFLMRQAHQKLQVKCTNDYANKLTSNDVQSFT